MSAPLQSAVDLLVQNRLVGAAPAAAPVVRRETARELERQVQRALWRAERRGRWLPLEVRRGASWVNMQRRKIAYEISRALRSLGATQELTRAIATQACARFPRDGIVISAAAATPRDRGTSPRQRGTNPRAQGTSPRQLRQKRAAADLSNKGTRNAPATAVATPPTVPPGRPVEELAPGWQALKDTLMGELTPEERTRARKAARDERERLRQLRGDGDQPPPTTERRS